MISDRNASLPAPWAALPAFALFIAAIAIAPPPAACQSDAAAEALSKTRSIAESQHEIVIALIGKKDFEQALIEANKIFDLSWPPDQEPLLLKELLILTDKFIRSGQGAVGIRLLETNLKLFKIRANQASIWKEKGYAYKSLKQNDRAVECFREAQRLEK